MCNCLKVTHMLSLFFQSFKKTGRPCSPCWEMKRKGRHGPQTTATRKKQSESHIKQLAARSPAEVAAFGKKIAASWAAKSTAEVAEIGKKIGKKKAANWAAKSPAEVAEIGKNISASLLKVRKKLSEIHRKKLSEIQIKRLNQARWELREELSKLAGNTYEKSNVVLSDVRKMFDGLKASHKNRLE